MSETATDPDFNPNSNSTANSGPDSHSDPHPNSDSNTYPHYDACRTTDPGAIRASEAYPE